MELPHRHLCYHREGRLKTAHRKRPQGASPGPFIQAPDALSKCYPRDTSVRQGAPSYILFPRKPRHKQSLRDTRGLGFSSTRT